MSRLGPTLAVLLVMAAAPATAHRLAPSLLELRELGAGRVSVHWRTPLLQPSGVDLRPRLPDHCERATGVSVERDATGASVRWSEECGAPGLVGARIGIAGLAESRTAALVRVELADGRRVQAVLDGERATLTIEARARPLAVLKDYVGLGLGHILTGPDHLLFVLGLVLLVSGGRALILTVTAFTAGHSATLSLAVLGFVSFPTRPIEIGIAASILVLAVELTREGAASRLRRSPWLMALGFGLLHGLGFAGALAEAGLPGDEIPLALLGFNVGIELGQLLFVAAVLVVRAALRPLLWAGPRWLAHVPVYAIGSLGAFWCFERIADWL
jgi:hydrogenase/urease accessory protein HupE